MAIRNYFFLAFALLLMLTALYMLKTKWPLKKRRRVTLTVMSFVLAFAAVAGVVLFPGLNSLATTGTYTYTSQTIQLNDTSREETYLDDESCRKLSVIVYYPTGVATGRNSSPLIVFSHGGISYKDSNTSLFKELASHGYVVASIDHTYQSLYTTIDGNKIWIDSDYMKALSREDSNRDIAGSFTCFQNWMDIRTADISFVIDSLIAESAEENNGFYSLIDADRIGVMGHSLGGAAALGVARQRSDVKACTALESPFLCDITGYDGTRFTWNTAPFPCALMNIYSDSGYPLIAADNKYEQNKRYLLNDGNVEFYYIEGSNHYTLTDLVRSAPVLCAVLGGTYSTPGPESLKIVNEKCLSFFDKYL